MDMSHIQGSFVAGRWGANAGLANGLVRWVGRRFPVRPSSEFPHATLEGLRTRNGWIDGMCAALCIVGIFAPLWLYEHAAGPHDWRPLGIGLGLMVCLPLLFACLVTLPFGASRLREFGRYYELRYGIGIRGIAVTYSPLVAVGLIAAVLWLRDH